MNLKGDGVLCIFVMVAAQTIGCVLGLYEPIVYFNANDIHYFAFQRVDYDTTNKHYVVKGVPKNEKIFSACPSQDPANPNAFDIQNTDVNKMSVIPICENPVESQIYLPQNPMNYRVVGFLIHTPDKEWIDQFLDIPEHHMVIGLIYFKLDEDSARIASLWYSIVGGKFLKPEVTLEEGELRQYQNNENLYDDSIDALYSQRGSPFVKVSLAPEEDFLFDNWKSASRQNILTAPMWRDLQSQWQALEVFIRKVTQIIHAVDIETGAYGQLSKKLLVHSGKRKRDPSIENIHWLDKKYKIPEYFWKAISLQFFSNNQQYNYGILFVMHNAVKLGSNTEWRIEEVCSDYDIGNLGWKFSQSTIYGCPFSEMAYFDEMIDEEEQFEDFNLNSLFVLEFNDDGDANVKEVNVVEEMEKLAMTENQDLPE